jgi:hypothetical protein
MLRPGSEGNQRSGRVASRVPSQEQGGRDQPAFGPDVNGREIDDSLDISVGFDGCLPGYLALSVRGWFDSVLLEDVADSCIRKVVADVGEGALDSIVAP